MGQLLLNDAGVSGVSDLTNPDKRDARVALIAKLTDGQRAVLDLGVKGFTSKEIARKLDISRHTVDQRFTRARLTLAATDRRETLRLYQSASLYDPIVYEPSQLHDSATIAPASLPLTHSEQAIGRVEDRRVEQGDRRSSSTANWLPFPTRKAQQNELTLTQRLFWIAAILIFSIIGVRVILESLLDLGELLRPR